MRAAALALCAAIAVLYAAPAYAPTGCHCQRSGSTSQTPQPTLDATPHAPTPVGRCVNDPALLHQCTQAYNRCSSVRHRTRICTTDFNRCCMPPVSNTERTRPGQH